MPDPLTAIACYALLLIATGVAVAFAVIWRAEARYWRFRAADWRTRYNAMRRRSVAYRVPLPTGYKDKLPYWDAYELNRFAEKTA